MMVRANSITNHKFELKIKHQTFSAVIWRLFLCIIFFFSITSLCIFKRINQCCDVHNIEPEWVRERFVEDVQLHFRRKFTSIFCKRNTIFSVSSFVFFFSFFFFLFLERLIVHRHKILIYSKKIDRHENFTRWQLQRNLDFFFRLSISIRQPAYWWYVLLTTEIAAATTTTAQPTIARHHDHKKKN